jgi:hypothetical protein
MAHCILDECQSLPSSASHSIQPLQRLPQLPSLLPAEPSLWQPIAQIWPVLSQRAYPFLLPPPQAPHPAFFSKISLKHPPSPPPLSRRKLAFRRLDGITTDFCTSRRQGLAGLQCRIHAGSPPCFHASRAIFGNFYPFNTQEAQISRKNYGTILI